MDQLFGLGLEAILLTLFADQIGDPAIKDLHGTQPNTRKVQHRIPETLDNLDLPKFRAASS